MRKLLCSRALRQTVQWLLFSGVVLYGATGLVMAGVGVFEPVSLGQLVRRICIDLHNNMLIPFVVLLVLHIALPYVKRCLNHSQQPGSPGCPQHS